MTRDDIIRMAREAGAGMLHGGEYSLFGDTAIERFAALVAAAEREAMIADGWRHCAQGQLTTQFCGQLEAAVAAEREEIMLLCHEIENDFKEELGVTGDSKFYERMLGVVECIDEIRTREQNV